MSYEVFDKIINAADRELAQQSEKTTEQRQADTLGELGYILTQARALVVGVNSHYFDRLDGAQRVADDFDYLGAQLASLQELICTGSQLAKLATGEVESTDELPELMRWARSLAEVKRLADDHDRGLQYAEAN